MHGRNVVHRDIKPENILLTVDGVVKICDFGVSRMFSSDGFLNLSDAIGTLWYQSPEILMGSKNYDSAADVWSVGTYEIHIDYFNSNNRKKKKILFSN